MNTHTTNTIYLPDLIENSGSNTEGLKLFYALENNLKNKVVIKTDKSMGFSSSFLNSSIGEYIEKYGIESFKENVSFQCTKNQFLIIKTYINTLNVATI